MSDPGFDYALARSSKLHKLERQLKTARKGHIHAHDALLEYELLWDLLNALRADNIWPGIRDNDQKESMEMLWQDHNAAFLKIADHLRAAELHKYKNRLREIDMR